MNQLTAPTGNLQLIKHKINKGIFFYYRYYIYIKKIIGIIKILKFKIDPFQK